MGFLSARTQRASELMSADSLSNSIVKRSSHQISAPEVAISVGTVGRSFPLEATRHQPLSYLTICGLSSLYVP